MAPLHQLQDDLIAKYPSLKQTIIVPGKDNPLEEVWIAWAHYIEKIVKNNDVIGLGWGKTVYQVALHITPKDVS